MHTYPLVRPSDLSAQSNGRLGANLLELTDGGDSLHHIAARAFDAMHAHAQRMGVTLAMTDGYRPYPTQERLFTERYLRTYNPLKTTTQSKVWSGQRWWKRRGVATAAVPGTSNHGWGLAADIKDASGALLRWLEEFAADYGFSWELLPEEPWHIRYVTGERIPLAVLAYETPAPLPPPVVVADADEEDDMKGMQIIGDGGGVYAFFPGGVVINMGGMGDMHVRLHETGVAPVVMTGMPQGQLDQFAAQWQAAVA